MSSIERLIFVYDARSGSLSAFADTARKMLMIKSCALCTITHGVLGERASWTACRSALPVPIDYRHRDDMPGEVRLLDLELPAVVAVLEDGRPRPLLDREDLERCQGDARELKARIELAAARERLRLGFSAAASRFL